MTGVSKIGRRAMASAAERSAREREMRAVTHPTLEEFLRAEREERERAEARRDPRQRSMF
jgi:hypothetical protein